MASNALTLDYLLGYNKDLVGGLHALFDGERQAVVYPVSHTLVVFDLLTKRQHLLQGHCNAISSVAVSSDRKWIVSADKGAEAMIVIWEFQDSEGEGEYVPIKTIFDPLPGGVETLDISRDSVYIAALSADVKQEIAVWDWSSDSEKPVARSEIMVKDFQTVVRFNPGRSREIATNGKKKTVFWLLDDEKGVFTSKTPPVSSKDFKQAIGAFTSSCFLAGSDVAITGTVDGDVILWDVDSFDVKDFEAEQKGSTLPERKAQKIMRLHSHGAVTVLDTFGNFIVSGGFDGYVRIFDFQFRLVAWYEDLDAGPVSSVSFAAQVPDVLDEQEMHIPDFVVSTREARIFYVPARVFELPNPEARRGTTILEGLPTRIVSMVLHPTLPVVFLGGENGKIFAYDHLEKRFLVEGNVDKKQDPLAALLGQQSKDSEKKNKDAATAASTAGPPIVDPSLPAAQYATSMALDSDGNILIVGLCTGYLKLLDSSTLEEISQFHHSRDAITFLKFSPDNRCIAFADKDRCVGLLRLEPEPVPIDEEPSERQRRDIWTFIGKYRCHRMEITGLNFSQDVMTKELHLISVSKDRTMVEFDVASSSIGEGITIAASQVLEESCTPLVVAYRTPPPVPDPANPLSQLNNGFYVTANDEYKFRILVPSSVPGESLQLYQTVLAPTYGEPPSVLMELPAVCNVAGRESSAEKETDESSTVPQHQYMAYGTPRKVVGLIRLPFDGNPNNTMGLIAHSRGIVGMGVSSDGRYLVSAGSDDFCLALHKIDLNAFDSTIALGGSGIEPFVSLIDEGESGQFFEEIKDYFVYAQLRSAGEDTMEKRTICGEIPLDSVPDIMRALGFYPTEREVEDMINEVRVTSKEQKGLDQMTVNFEEFVRLYVNHRPVRDIGLGDIEKAFTALGAEPMTGLLDRQRLIQLVQDSGNKMSKDELQSCLVTLSGLEGSAEQILEPQVPASDFASEILGFDIGAEDLPEEPSASDERSGEDI